MNLCVFTGYLAEDPVLAKVDGVSFLDLRLVIYNYRRTKSTGEKSRTPVYLYFEAWHTGAETIAKLASKGTKITVHASAKNTSKDAEDVVFRINEFDLNLEDDQ
jgi:single-stranded DNA-binding protein